VPMLGPTPTMPSDSLSPVQRLYAQLLDEKTHEPAAPEIRLGVAAALAAHPFDSDAAAHLDDMLTDSDRSVRQAAIGGLATIFAARPEAVSELLYDERALDSLRPFYEAVARYLSTVGTPEALDALLAVLEHEEHVDDHQWLLDRVAATARFSTAMLALRLQVEERRDPERATFLAEILARRDDERGHARLVRQSRRTYVDSLVARGPDGVRLLCRIATGVGNLDTQEEIVERLAAQRAKTEATVRALARDPTAPGAACAVMTLGYWDDPESVEALVALARSSASSSKDVREAALEALARLEAPEAIELLCEGMEDEGLDEVTRWTCAEGLGAIGNTAALPALEAVAAKYAERELGKYAREAIEAIRE
jgi:HEAT repeat protein